MRTYRHNRATSEHLEPARCEVCRELVALHVVHVYPRFGAELEHLVCAACLSTFVQVLVTHELEYRVGGLWQSA